MLYIKHIYTWMKSWCFMFLRRTAGGNRSMCSDSCVWWMTWSSCWQVWSRWISCWMSHVPETQVTHTFHGLYIYYKLLWLSIATCAKQRGGALFRVCWHTGNEARSAWKALKAEYLERVQEVEGLISTLRVRTEELQGKRKTLETLLSTLQIKVVRL